jgi:hypothetical protein
LKVESVQVADKIKDLKKQAKQIKKLTGLSQTQALNALAEKHGFKNWATLRHQCRDNEVKK